VTRRSEAEVKISDIGTFKAFSYTTMVDDLEHLVLVKGEPSPDRPILGRVHQENIMGDIFRSDESESRWRLEYALREIEAEGCGVLVYLQKSAPRVSAELDRLSGKVLDKPQPELDRGAIGLPPDLREFGIGAQLLLDQGVRQLKVLTSTPSRIRGLEGYGITVVDEHLIPTRQQR
jgi:3,4-dihydroxy 2-butanone 4-phosphate synthase/GTP cyclohydrolase II